jgi:hypothetical protein
MKPDIEGQTAVRVRLQRRLSISASLQNDVTEALKQ